jgi:hypothetical protein
MLYEHDEFMSSINAPTKSPPIGMEEAFNILDMKVILEVFVPQLQVN